MKCKLMKVTMVDHIGTGQEFREWRERLEVSLRLVAERLQLQPGYVSDLERGRRNWDDQLAAQFTNILEGKTLDGKPGRPWPENGRVNKAA